MSRVNKIEPEEPVTILTLTPKAEAKIQEFQRQDTSAQGKHFRVYVEGGGCGGFQYGFTFDDQREGDAVLRCGDIQVLVDPKSRLYLSGSEVDYNDSLMDSGFVVRNPQSKGGCGCGKSFSV